MDDCYTIIVNTPGYLPDSDPYIVAGIEDARAAMLAEIERHADHIAQGDLDTEGDLEVLADVERTIAELRTADITHGWSGHVATSSSEHDLGLAFSLTPCPTLTIDVTSDGWHALAEQSRDDGTIVTFTDGESTWSDPLRCPDCHSTNVEPAHGHHLARCDNCGIAYDGM